MANITLHPTAGVNPTVAVCFWCGEDTGELALLGRNKGKVAAHRTILNYTPCPKCQEAMANGVTVIEVIPAHGGNPEFHGTGLAPTGAWVVIKEEAVQRLPIGDVAQKTLLDTRKGLMDKEAFQQLFGAIEENDN